MKYLISFANIFAIVFAAEPCPWLTRWCNSFCVMVLL